MNLLSVIMRCADLICIVLVLYFVGLNFFTVVLTIIMVSKGIMSFV